LSGDRAPAAARASRPTVTAVGAHLAMTPNYVVKLADIPVFDRDIEPGLLPEQRKITLQISLDRDGGGAKQ
jgi:hypothetical protein